MLADGQTVEASGRIVSVPGKPVRLCAPVPIPAIAYTPGHEPAPAWCPLGVDVTGVNLSSLQQSRTKSGATEGWGYVRGVYRNGTVITLPAGGEANVHRWWTVPGTRDEVFAFFQSHAPHGQVAVESAFTNSGARYLQLEAADPRHRPPAIVQVVLAQVGDRVAIQIDAEVEWGQG